MEKVVAIGGEGVWEEDERGYHDEDERGWWEAGRYMVMP